ncbi:lactate racemase domain-containing protein [candidate division KSB1 bacterium]
MTAGLSRPEGVIGENEVREFITESIDPSDYRDRRVLVVIPDHTRTGPLPLLFRTIADHLKPVTRQLDFMVALGTHPAMEPDAIDRLVGMTADERRKNYGETQVVNHEWDNPDHLVTVGSIPADEIKTISGGLLGEEVPVTLNRAVTEYDPILLVGPVFPHEVVGFSGGNKYLFPGIAGKEIINFTHWLGALISNPAINGEIETPVRRVIDRAASMLQSRRLNLSMVVTHDGLKGLFYGEPEAAYREAAALSAAVQIVYKPRAFSRVLSMAPEMYDDVWTAGKCMYKLEPVVADGGELIIYAPHVTEISYTHGKILDKIGYHVRDYFLEQWDRFKDVPRGVLAHSTHVRGIGTYKDGVEKPRVTVTLATQISPERCARVNLGYMNPDDINPAEWEGREEEGVLLVPNAGEKLHRLK